MAIHGMIDLETLSTRPDATVLTLGAIKFDPYTDSEPHAGLYLRVDVDEQSELSRHVDEGTLEWWGRQDEKIKDEALGDEDRVSLNSMVKQLNKWCVGIDELWCQGPLFDYAILQNLYAQLGQPVPWNYWQIRVQELYSICYQKIQEKTYKCHYTTHWLIVIFKPKVCRRLINILE